MNNEKKNNGFSIAVVALVLLAVSVGYALISRNYNFSGTANLGGNSWNITPPGKDDITEEPANPDNPPEITTDPETGDVTIKYTAKLDKPGDVYTLTVPISNDGTIDALLDTVNTDVAGSISKYVTYEIVDTKSGKALTDEEVSKGAIEFNNGETMNVKITVKYNEQNDLPSTDVSGTLKTTLHFVQSK